jgi:hypothetical protein
MRHSHDGMNGHTLSDQRKAIEPAFASERQVVAKQRAHRRPEAAT